MYIFNFVPTPNYGFYISVDVLKTEDIDNPPSEFIANKMKKNGQKSSNSLRGG